MAWQNWAMWSAPPILMAVGGYFYIVGRPVYCRSQASLYGKTAVITGANTGIGKETALDLARRGARVICACRDQERGTRAVKEIRELCGHNNVIFEELDLNDFDSIRTFGKRIVEREPELHILINNAGINNTGRKNEKTKQGFDAVFGVNHLGHFLLTYLLLDLLKASAPSRIINVSSLLHKGPWARFKHRLQRIDGAYPDLVGYGTSKAANVLHARKLSQSLQGTGVTANSLHPGVVNSDIYRRWLTHGSALQRVLIRVVRPLLAWDCKAGAQTSIYCAVDESLETLSGKYFEKCAVAEESKMTKDDELAERLWDVSMELCGLNGENI